ncbi:MAG: hypothetical protein ACLQFR_13800 [Streptosporangiaceae bacterium]
MPAGVNGLQAVEFFVLVAALIAFRAVVGFLSTWAMLKMAKRLHIQEGELHYGPWTSLRWKAENFPGVTDVKRASENGKCKWVARRQYLFNILKIKAFGGGKLKN